MGTVNAEAARKAGETNWYHHVILELDGKIYDFDFKNQPSVTTIAEYAR